MTQSMKDDRKAEVIQPNAYKPLLRSADVAQFLQTLNDSDVVKRADNIIATKGDELRDAIHGYLAKMEAAHKAGDMEALYDEAHEIRGFAETVGLRAAGRITSGLCGYLDEMKRIGIAPDPSLVTLYVEATARATRATDDTTRLGTTVAIELAALATRKLAEAKDKIKK